MARRTGGQYGTSGLVAATYANDPLARTMSAGPGMMPTTSMFTACAATEEGARQIAQSDALRQSPPHERIGSRIIGCSACRFGTVWTPF